MMRTVAQQVENYLVIFLLKPVLSRDMLVIALEILATSFCDFIKRLTQFSLFLTITIPELGNKV